MTKPLDDEVFAISFAIVKQCSYGENSLNDDWLPASGTDFSLNDNLETADRQF